MADLKGFRELAARRLEFYLVDHLILNNFE